MKKINLIDANDFLIEVELEGVTWFLHFSWNSEIQRWEFGIENAKNEAILVGLPIIEGEPLTALYKHLDIIRGEFYAVSIDRTRPIGRTSFIDGGAEFIYIEAANV